MNAKDRGGKGGKSRKRKNYVLPNKATIHTRAISQNHGRRVKMGNKRDHKELGHELRICHKIS